MPPIGIVADITNILGSFIMAANDMKSAEKTYSSFISMLKVSVPILALLTLLIVILIAD